MVCYHEIIYDGPVNNDETILVSEEEWNEAEGDTTDEKAEAFVPYGVKVKQVEAFCDDELLEHLSDYYSIIKRGGY